MQTATVQELIREMHVHESSETTLHRDQLFPEPFLGCSLISESLESCTHSGLLVQSYLPNKGDSVREAPMKSLIIQLLMAFTHPLQLAGVWETGTDQTCILPLKSVQ